MNEMLVMLPDIPILLSYSIDGNPISGTFVEVPFRSSVKKGIVWTHDDNYNIEKKSVIRTLDLPPLSQISINLCKWVSNYYIVHPAYVLKTIISHMSESKTTTVFNLTKSSSINLNDEQQKVVDMLRHDQYNPILLQGVTGSGKTETYFKMIRETLLLDGMQVLILLPEINLTKQWHERFVKEFGSEPSIWHSRVSSKKKEQTWNHIINGQAKVIVGARSAIFLPYKKLGLIIIDEEHDHSYKQENDVPYNARDIAVLLAKWHNCTIVLASATPSIESFYNAKIGKYNFAKIEKRYNDASLPQIAVLEHKSSPDNPFSPQMIAQINKTLENNQQALVLLNRRGYAPVIECSYCNKIQSCIKCSTNLVLHKKGNRVLPEPICDEEVIGIEASRRGDIPRTRNGLELLESHTQTASEIECMLRSAILLCHYCGYEQAYTCCASSDFCTYGIGTERLEEYVQNQWPNAKTAIMSTDTTHTNKKLASVIEQMESKKIDILIGTQMIAKGHNFENVAMVGVLDADISISNGDFRSIEKTYQLLTQVAGRAGRFAIKGNVIIQTSCGQEAIIKKLLSTQNFYDEELTRRKAYFLPPFVRFALFTVYGYSPNRTKILIKALTEKLPHTLSVIGPAPAPLFRHKFFFRYHAIIYCPKEQSFCTKIEQWKKSWPKFEKGYKASINIDPINFI